MLGLKATMAVIDNSGALLAECVNVLKTKTGHGMARIGKQIQAPRASLLDRQADHLTLGFLNNSNYPQQSATLSLPLTFSAQPALFSRMSGDEIVVVVRRARPISTATNASPAASAPKVRRGDVRRAVVVRTKYPTRRPDGRYIRFDDNAAVLINSKKEMIGNRIGGVVSAELRARGWGKIVSLAKAVV